MKVNVDGLTPVEKTALLTLYARALDSRCRRPILFDNRADEVTGKLNYDFDALRMRASVRCPVALRAKMLDERVRRFTAEHPEAVVVDLGAGLSDGVVRACPPVTVDWYNVDLPAVIALRDEVLPPSRQEISVAARIGDAHWADAIPADRHTMLVADGLTAFLSEPAIVDLFLTVTDHFRTGELAFNDYGSIGWVSRAALKLVPQGTSKAFSNAGFADAAGRPAGRARPCAGAQVADYALPILSRTWKACTWKFAAGLPPGKCRQVMPGIDASMVNSLGGNYQQSEIQKCSVKTIRRFSLGGKRRPAVS